MEMIVLNRLFWRSTHQPIEFINRNAVIFIFHPLAISGCVGEFRKVAEDRFCTFDRNEAESGRVRERKEDYKENQALW